MHLPSVAFRSLSSAVAFGTLALLAPLAATNLSAQVVPGGRIITDKSITAIDINYAGQASIDEGRIRANMITKVGDPYTSDTTTQIITRLYKSGLVKNVSVRPTLAGGGVHLLVTVTAQGPIGAIQFQGVKDLHPETLRKISGLKAGDVVNPPTLLEARGAVLDKYHRKGYPDATVRYRTFGDMEGGYTRVVFLINEGQRALLNDIVFKGTTVFPEKELKKLMETKEKNLYRIFSGTAGKLNRSAEEADGNAVERHYKNHGYLNARVTDVQRVQVDGEKHDLHLKISEGDKYMITGVAIEGMSKFPATAVTPSLSQLAGAPYSLAAIQQDRELIEDYYGAFGYANCRTGVRLADGGSSNDLRVIYEVREGERTFVNKINIGGNTRTKDAVIRRELPFTPGEPYNTVKIEAGKKRLQNMGYFNAVDFLPVETNTAAHKDLNVTVNEKQTGSVNFGAGVSSIDDVVAFFDFTQSNFDITDPPRFTGGGQKFRIGIKYGSKRRDFQLSLTEPWFLGQRLSLGGELFYRDLLFYSSQYDQRNYGGAVHIRKPLGSHAYARAEYRLQNVKILEIDDEASDAIRAEEGDYLESQINLSLVHDTRDSVFLARTGHKLDFGTSITGEFLGGDVDIYGLQAGAVQHFNLPGDLILTFEGRAQLADSFDSDGQVPIFERLFLGGARSLRGFDYREVSPKDELGEPLGGRSSAYGTVELTFPIIDKVRGAAFYDAGFVNPEGGDWDTENYNSNWGFGLRIYLPVGPIQLDYGIPMESDEFNESSGRFNFYLGYEF